MKAKIYPYRFWTTETSPDTLRAKLYEYLEKAGFGVVCYAEKRFEPQGYSGVWIISESHLAFHTFPERGKTYVELSSCNKEKCAKFKELDTLEKTCADD